ncbi:WD40 repeat-containing protein HOS15-like [Dioscorea cayenensis subsp. rotundata]|uniref:WD40 repeat-containing protein HOS15-like n=1 Tax=Dioscorea cayennensis subsp. rotundata TaxID=55577 RepID=A0AB40CXV9_DIOCR|nr:WD40 repeat-containing protein HOS15-like [Dioscorea cayenensis subsp. rotundata]
MSLANSLPISSMFSSSRISMKEVSNALHFNLKMKQRLRILQLIEARLTRELFLHLFTKVFGIHNLRQICMQKENAKGKRKRVDSSESDQKQGSNKWERNINVYGGPQLKVRTSSLPPVTHQVSDSDVYLLEGHSVEVSACAWSPTDSLLAVGSSDSMALIWKISDDLSKIYSSNPDVRCLIRPDPKNDGLDGVSTLAWNGGGELLATGSFDGLASIWTKNGELKKALDNHKDTILFIAWNSNDAFLITGSGSSDNRVVVWDTNRWESMQEVAFDSEQLIGVAWRNGTSFAACSGDKRICVYNIGESQPVKTFSGYQDEVCGINWNPTGSLLASYPHDKAIKIWTLEQDESLHDLMHNEIVHC